ncbi:MAG: DUF5060 domain-containing protein [Saprospiraceae bacterium]|nr:DUF5060 domain-containing protein [Saprospiraceae bacterium]
MKKQLANLLFSFMSLSVLQAQTPNIGNVNVMTPNIGRFEKFEAAITINGTINNPYDYDEVLLRGIFTAPSGRKDTIEGFFMQDFDLNTSTGSLTTSASNFRIRFSPNEIGTWQYSFSLATGQAFTGNFSVQNNNSKGFIRKNGTNYLGFDMGEQYVPVGQNLAWHNTNPYLDYKKWLEKMGAAKANFMRLWLSEWGVGLEGKIGTGAGFEGLKKYKQNNAWYIDYIVEKCREQGIYIMFCQNHHGQVSTTVNPAWNDNPYNAANGGPCAQTVNFFDNETAKKLHKNRLRYVIARWGYSTQIMAWELFNEVSYTDGFLTPSVKTAVRNWHIEMAQFIRQKDPHKHLVTTSFSGEEDPVLWQRSEIDFTQNHSYVDAANLESILAEISRNNINTFGKPTLNTEFGLNPSNISLSTIDPNGIHIHNALWGTTFSGAMGAGGTWWWDSYVELSNLYRHFTPLSNFLSKQSLKADNFKSTKAVSMDGNQIGQLSLTPGSGWGQPTSNTFTIDATGSISPSVTQLSVYLYGNQFNTQYRNPPTFNVNYTSAGTFKVKTGGSMGQSPSLAIYLDGNVALNISSASVNQTYTINIPTGQHKIKIDNLGKDWIYISAYEFTGIAAAPFNVYALKSIGNEKAVGWIHNRKYNWKDVGTSGVPAMVSDVQVSVEGMNNGLYEVSFYDCSTAEKLGMSIRADVLDNKLTFTVPPINWDLAFRASPIVTKTTEIATQNVKIYPNPIRQGDILKISPNTEGVHGEYILQIYHLNGQVLKNEKLFFGGQDLEIETTNLPKGYYMLRMNCGKQQFLGRFVVQ